MLSRLYWDNFVATHMSTDSEVSKVNEMSKRRIHAWELLQGLLWIYVNKFRVSVKVLCYCRKFRSISISISTFNKINQEKCKRSPEEFEIHRVYVIGYLYFILDKKKASFLFNWFKEIFVIHSRKIYLATKLCQIAYIFSVKVKIIEW